MYNNIISFQLTIFTKIEIENAKSIAKSFDENYNKTSFPISSNLPLYKITAKDLTEQIDISPERIDCFYREYDAQRISQFINFVDKNKDKIDNITRIALNYSYFINDETGNLKNRLNHYHNFYNTYGDVEEIYFRINNPQVIDGLKFNIITDCQSNIVQNNQTFESIKCIIFHYDINNVAVKNININSLSQFFDKMNEKLKFLIKKTEGTLNE